MPVLSPMSDLPPIRDVVFVVEDTASAGPFIQEVIAPYIIPTLEYFNGNKDIPWAAVECSSTFTLVLFQASDCIPNSSVSYRGPFTTTKAFVHALENVRFVGGMGETHSSGNEGIALALQCLEDLRVKRKSTVVASQQQDTEKHIIFVANSPSYEMNVMDVPDFMGQSVEQLVKMVKEREIHFSVICPRKLPFFIRLFEAAGGDIKVVREKNYAKDPVHLVLPNGFQLQERPVTPKPPPSPVLPQTAMTASPLPINQQQQQATTVNSSNMNFQQANNAQMIPQQQQQQQQQQQIVSTTSMPGQNPTPPPNMNVITQPMIMQQQQRPRMTVNPIPQQQQPAMKPMQQPMQMQQQRMQGQQRMQLLQQQQQQQQQQQHQQQMLMQQQNPGGQWNIQQHQQQQPQPSTIASSAASQSSVLRERLIKNSQQQQAAAQAAAAQAAQVAQQQQQQVAGDNATLKSLLNHPPQIGVGGIIQQQQQQQQPALAGQQQAQIRMSALQQQLSRPVNPTLATGMMNNSPQQQQQQQQQQQSMVQQGMQMNNPMMQQQQAQMMQTGQQQQQQTVRAREIIWEGELQWRENTKLDTSQEKMMHTVVCSVTSSKENGVTEVKSDNWPRKLIMQLIPKSLVQTIGGHYFRNSRSVLFHPEQSESLEALTRVLGTGYAGCVHFTGVQNCDIKVLILLYSNDKKAYLGFIPNDQVQFVDRIRKVIQQQKSEQQQQQQQQQQQNPPRPNLQMGGVQQQGMMQQQQQQQQQMRIGQGVANSGMAMAGGTISMATGGQNQSMMATVPGGMMEQQPRGDINRIQSLQHELQQELQALRQHQQLEGGGVPIVGGMMVPQQQQQQQQRMMGPGVMQQQAGRGGLRQILQQQPPQFQQRQPQVGGGMMQQQQLQRPQMLQQQQINSGQQSNDPMLRELLG